MTSLRFCDFFSGIGGFRLGLERAGHVCVWSCEIDDFARSVYATRFGRAPEAEDITRVRADEIPDADLWCGGFPCQDVSTAGRRTGINGERTGLFWTLLDLARARRPRWLLLENVPGLLTGRDDEDADDVPDPRGPDGATPIRAISWFGAVLGALDECGYDVAWRVLDAQFFRVAQQRRRVFILAGRAGEEPHPASVLLERAGLCRNPPQGRAARQAFARLASQRSGVGGEARGGGEPRSNSEVGEGIRRPVR